MCVSNDEASEQRHREEKKAASGAQLGAIMHHALVITKVKAFI